MFHFVAFEKYHPPTDGRNVLLFAFFGVQGKHAAILFLPVVVQIQNHGILAPMVMLELIQVPFVKAVLRVACIMRLKSIDGGIAGAVQNAG